MFTSPARCERIIDLSRWLVRARNMLAIFEVLACRMHRKSALLHRDADTLIRVWEVVREFIPELRRAADSTGLSRHHVSH
jgi:hypothetical protein